MTWQASSSETNRGLSGAQESGKRRRVWSRADWVWLAALLAVGLGVRLAYLAQVTFPPLDDPTFYLQTAANLVKGRGLVIDAIWSYQIPWQTVTHPSHEYWMPLTTFLIAASYELFGVSLRSGQLPGLLSGLALIGLTYAAARDILASRSPAVVAALLIAISGPLAYQSVSADSSAPFALLGAAAIGVAIWARARKRTWAFALTGALIGLSYLTRADGILLWIVAIAAWWSLQGDLAKAWRLWALSAGGFIIVALPWWIRNSLTFGTPVPAGALGTALQLQYTDQFRFPYEMALAPFSALTKVRLDALLHNVTTWLLLGFPYAVVAVLGFVALRKHHLRVIGWYLAAMIALLAVVFPVPSLAGTFYHSVGAMLPYTAIAAVGGLAWLSGRGRRARAAALAIGLTVVLLALGQAALSWGNVGAVHRQQAEVYQKAGDWLVAHTKAPIVTSQPHTLNYVSGLPTVALPVGQPAEVALAVVQKYGAEYACLTQQFGLYPDAMRDSPLFTLTYQGDGFEIYKVAR